MKQTYLLKDGDDVEGWAYTTNLQTTIYGRSSYLINQIYIAPKHRGKGLAKELLKQMVYHADWEGADLILDFQPEEFGSDPERLMKLYESFGFAWDKSIGGLRREPKEIENA